MGRAASGQVAAASHVAGNPAVVPPSTMPAVSLSRLMGTEENPGKGCDFVDNPKPSGYNAQVVLKAGGRPILMLCDTGACTPAISEEAVLSIMSKMLEEIQAGRIDRKADHWPIRRLQKF